MVVGNIRHNTRAQTIRDRVFASPSGVDICPTINGRHHGDTLTATTLLASLPVPMFVWIPYGCSWWERISSNNKRLLLRLLLRPPSPPTHTHKKNRRGLDWDNWVHNVAIDNLETDRQTTRHDVTRHAPERRTCFVVLLSVRFFGLSKFGIPPRRIESTHRQIACSDA